MSNELTVPRLNEAQQRIISGKTPEKYIKTRPGRGGLNFSYVEVGYVIEQLNKAFNLAWDWEIEDQQIGKREIWVRGKLTIYFSPTFKVVKSAYGGAQIKTNQSGDNVDVGDDLKAASADALKKAASLIGVAADVYFPQLDRLEEAEDAVATKKASEVPPDQSANLQCSECGEPITQAVYKFSTERLGTALCYNCQKKDKEDGGVKEADVKQSGLLQPGEDLPF